MADDINKIMESKVIIDKKKPKSKFTQWIMCPDPNCNYDSHHMVVKEGQIVSCYSCHKSFAYKKDEDDKRRKLKEDNDI